MDRRTLWVATRAAFARPAGRRVAAETLTGDGPMRELCEKDMSSTPVAQRVAGGRRDIRGFVTPPLEAALGLFAPTKRPMSVRRAYEASRPRDIAAVSTEPTPDVVPVDTPITTTGGPARGTHHDPALGSRPVDATRGRS